MKQILAIAVLMVAASSFAAAQMRTNSKTEEEIRRINSEVDEAVLRGDKATLERLIADDYLYVGMNGNTRTKNKLLTTNVQGLPANVKYSSKYEDVVVRDFGGTAVLSSWVVEEIEVNGQKNNTRYRTTNVFMRRKGKWQLIATHSSPPIPANGKSK